MGAPFYEWLSVAYIDGPSAVTFFFCLSGALSSTVYMRMRCIRAVLALAPFAVLRFTLLYRLKSLDAFFCGHHWHL